MRAAILNRNAEACGYGTRTRGQRFLRQAGAPDSLPKIECCLFRAVLNCEVWLANHAETLRLSSSDNCDANPFMMRFRARDAVVPCLTV